MFLDRESDILYEECLQCSFRRDIMSLTNVANSQIEREKAPALEERAKVLSPFGWG